MLNFINVYEFFVYLFRKSGKIVNYAYLDRQRDIFLTVQENKDTLDHLCKTFSCLLKRNLRSKESYMETAKSVSSSKIFYRF
jgi:hypothetical protein